MKVSKKEIYSAVVNELIVSVFAYLSYSLYGRLTKR